jgi:uncharacterized protein
MKIVFVDTSGFYACLDSTDLFHPLALDAFQRAEREGWQLITTSYVIHETWALVQRRLGWQAVDSLVNDLLPRCTVIWVDSELHEAAAARCRRIRERRLSLTDSASLECLASRRIEEAIAQDEHFAREGIRLP